MNQKTIFGLVLAFSLAGCNLAQPGGSTPKNPGTQAFAAGTVTPTPIAQLTGTPTATATVSPTPTATVNPNVIPHLAAGTAIDLTTVHMLDSQHGWGVGGAALSGLSSNVFRTSDGGATWVDVTPPELNHPSSNQTAAVGFFLDANTAWINFYGVAPSGVPAAPLVWKTTDGGLNWQAGPPLNTTDLNEVFQVSEIFFSGSTGWVLAHVGAGMNHDYVVLYRSSDGGMNWDRIIDPYNDSSGIQSCTKSGFYFSDGYNGWLAGDCNGVAPGVLLFQSSDGGSTWVHVDLPAPADRPDLFTDMAYACGIRMPSAYGHMIFLAMECENYTVDPMTTVSYLYSSPDGGATWNSVSYPGGDFETIDGTNDWAAMKQNSGGMVIYRSTNGGVSWTSISTVTWDDVQFSFVGPQLGWAIAIKNGGVSLVQSTNGGAVWSKLNPVVVAGP